MAGHHSSREERDASELLERERRARRLLQKEKHARLKIVSEAVQQLITHAQAIKGWAELVRDQPLNVVDRRSAMTRILSSVEQQLATLDELGLSTASIAERPVFELTRVNLTALVAAVVADSGERAELEPTDAAHSATYVFGDAEHVVRTVRALIEAARSPARVSLSCRPGRAEIRVGELDALPAEKHTFVSLLADIQGGGVEVSSDAAVFWLPMGQAEEVDGKPD